MCINWLKKWIILNSHASKYSLGCLFWAHKNLTMFFRNYTFAVLVLAMVACQNKLKVIEEDELAQLISKHSPKVDWLVYNARATILQNSQPRSNNRVTAAKTELEITFETGIGINGATELRETYSCSTYIPEKSFPQVDSRVSLWEA